MQMFNEPFKLVYGLLFFSFVFAPRFSGAAGNTGIDATPKILKDKGFVTAEILPMGSRNNAVFKANLTKHNKKIKTNIVIFHRDSKGRSEPSATGNLGLAVVALEGSIEGSTIYCEEFPFSGWSWSLKKPTGIYALDPKDSSPTVVIAFTMGASSGVQYWFGKWKETKMLWYKRGGNHIKVEDLDGNGLLTIVVYSRFAPPAVIAFREDRLVRLDRNYPYLYDDYIQDLEGNLARWTKSSGADGFNLLDIQIRALVSRGDVGRAKQVVERMIKHLDGITDDSRGSRGVQYWKAVAESKQLRAFCSISEGRTTDALEDYKSSMLLSSLSVPVNEEFTRMTQAVPQKDQRRLFVDPVWVEETRAKALRNVLATSPDSCVTAKAYKLIGDYYLDVFDFTQAKKAYNSGLISALGDPNCQKLALELQMLTSCNLEEKVNP
jgi:hypothetical protein